MRRTGRGERRERRGRGEGERDEILLTFPGPVQGADTVQASFEKKRSGAKGHKRLSGQSLTPNHGQQPHSSQL